MIISIEDFTGNGEIFHNGCGRGYGISRGEGRGYGSNPDGNGYNTYHGSHYSDHEDTDEFAGIEDYRGVYFKAGPHFELILY